MNSKNEKVKVLWFSRHEMSNEQKQDLVDKLGDIEITQINQTINHASEIKDEIEEADVVAIVAPIGLQQEFLRIAGERPVIMAKSDRVLVPDELGGEDKVVFQFQKWEHLKGIDIDKSDFQGVDNDKNQDKTHLLWFSRHEMSNEQKQDLVDKLGDIEITQINQTINHASEIKGEIEEADVVAIVAPIGLQQEFLRIAGERPVIMAKSDRVLVPDELGGEDKVVFQFQKWEHLKGIDIDKSDFLGLNMEKTVSIDDAETSLDDIIDGATNSLKNDVPNNAEKELDQVECK